MSSHSSSPFLSFVFACWPFFSHSSISLLFSLFLSLLTREVVLTHLIKLFRLFYDDFMMCHTIRPSLYRALVSLVRIFLTFSLCASLLRARKVQPEESFPRLGTHSHWERQQQESLKNTKCRVIDVLGEENCILKSFSLVQASRAHTRHREIDSVYCSSSYQQKQSSFVLHTEEYNEKKLIALGLLQITYFLITFFFVFHVGSFSQDCRSLWALCWEWAATKSGESEGGFGWKVQSSK